MISSQYYQVTFTIEILYDWTATEHVICDGKDPIDWASNFVVFAIRELDYVYPIYQREKLQKKPTNFISHPLSLRHSLSMIL